MLWIDAALLVHHPRLAKQITWEKLKIETDFAQQEIRHRCVKIDGNEDTLALRLYGDGVGDMPVGIDHWVKARHVARRVWITERGCNAVTYCLTTQLFGHRLPLSWRGLQADVAVGGDTQPVHNDTHTTLMSLGIEVAERHHIRPPSTEISLVVELECLSISRKAHQ